MLRISKEETDRDFQLWTLFITFEKELKNTRYLPFLAGFKYIFDDIYTRIFDGDKAVSRKILRFSNLLDLFSQLFWLLLWSLKYFLFFPILFKNKIALICFGVNKNLSLSYSDSILSWSINNKTNLLSLNIIKSFKYLFSIHIFYYPKFLFNGSHNSRQLLRNIIKDKFCDINKIQNDFTFIPSKYTINSIKYLNREMYAFYNLLYYKKSKILFLIQDFDYTDNKYIFSNLAKRFNIPTISIDHAIMPYKYMYSNSYSDIALVWGNYQKERIINNYGAAPKELLIASRPDTRFSIIETNKTKYYWTYIPVAYSHPGVISFNRNMRLLSEYISLIHDFLKLYHKDVELILKIHPRDNELTFAALKQKARICKDNEHSFLESELFFTEDSSLTIDLLRYDIPIIYMSDKNHNDPFKIREFQSIHFFDEATSLENTIKTALNTKIDWTKRKTHFDYFFEPNIDFTMYINDFLTRKFKYIS